MGRTLKRVPLDFAHPLKKAWPGYLNPHGGPCPEDGKTCFGGYTAAGKWLDAISRLLSLLASDASIAGPEHAAHRANRIYPHPYLQQWEQAPRTEVPRDVHAEIREHENQGVRMRMLGDYLRRNPPQLLPLTSELYQLIVGLNRGEAIDWLSGSSAAWHIAESLRNAAGMPAGWGVCQVCEGNADDPKKRAEAEAWKKEEPPAGDGFQLWETTSEGSPVSPVFAKLEELCAWCADNATTFGSFKTSAEEWRRMLDADFVVHTEGNMVFS
jgi:hypothetical protein